LCLVLYYYSLSLRLVKFYIYCLNVAIVRYNTLITVVTADSSEVRPAVVAALTTYKREHIHELMKYNL
jgi:hypothetical protein